MALPWPGSAALLLLWVCCTAGEVRNCGYLDIPNGHVYGNEPATSFPKRLGDKHYYRCDSGFLPPNKAHWQTIVCTRSGWDPEPNCFKKCEHTEPIRNGRFIYGHWTSPFIEGDTIFFSCDEGYNPLDESATATCTKDGWSPPPSCVTSADVTCRDPPLVDNADIVEERAESYLPGHELHYQCHEGFEISGSDTIRCENKKWSTPPRCEAKNCGYVHIPNGYIYRNEPLHHFPKRLGYETYYRCNSGFLPPSKETWQKMVCTKSGWNPEPKCLKICEHKIPITNGKFIYNYWTPSFIEGNTISYSCEKGYHSADESTTVTCTKAGWSPTPRCARLEEIRPSSCENIAPQNGFFVDRKDRFSLSETVTYRCQSGFTTAEGHEEGQAECQAEGWKPEPKCIKTCLMPTEENAVFDTTKPTFSSKEILRYVCKDGFQTVKETTGDNIQCTDNGWDQKPVCLPIECEGPVLENGRVEERKDKFVNGDVVRFSCSKGYTRVGPDSAQCYHFGWSPQPPKCKKTANPCVQPNSTSPLSPAYGERREEYQHGEKVAYECDIGFVMTGSNTIECVDGEWTSLPSCTEELKTCGRPPRITSGRPINVDEHRYKHNETADYECWGEIDIPGLVTATCLHGKWELPLCTGECRRPKNTKFVPDVPNKEFKYNETANYSCHSTFHTTKCVGGKWSPEPECKELCPPPPQLPNAVNITEIRNYKNGEEVGYKCVEPFVLQGPQKIMCEGGRWQTPPRCVDTRCGDPPSISNGEARHDAPRKYAPGESMEYFCHEGFEIVGSRTTAKCENMEWSKLPSCKEKSCQKPPAIFNASYHKTVKLSYKPGDKVDYECHPGFAAKGPQTITCIRGEWSQPSICEDVTCREPPLVDNAGIVEERAESYLPGHELHYQCHEGFEISGSDTIRCENKKWSTPPRCEDMRCSAPPDIENGRLNGVRKPWYFPLEKVKYRCLPSYSLFGPYAAMCLKREWINLPECRAVAGRCDRPPAIENGDILEMAKSEYLSGEKVHYKCQNLYRMDGNAEVTCHNGHWTQPPTCIVPCTASEEDMKMNNIQLKWKYDSKLYSESGDSTEFICRWGYRPDRTSPPFRVQCIDGRFEYPRCVRSA